MANHPYSTDLSDAAWAMISPLLHVKTAVINGTLDQYTGWQGPVPQAA
jgi:hypothetical protein